MSNPTLLDGMLEALDRPEEHRYRGIRAMRAYWKRLQYELLLRSDIVYRACVLRSRMISFDDVRSLRLSHRWYYFYLIAGPLMGVARFLDRTFRGR